MSKEKVVKFYSPLEEAINIGSHALGVILSVVALVFLVIKSSLHGDAWHIVSFSIYGVSLIILYTASTLYHGAKIPYIRRRLKVFDHAAIYVLIAGSYTPYALVTLNGKPGWILFGVSWGVASIGIILKLFFTGRFQLISTLAYVLMGWMVIFVIDDLVENLSKNGLNWLVAGGVSYTVGALIYAIPKIKLNHAIFHVFVLLGSFCHFISVYFYVLEVKK
jgi:hemolysin III